MANNVQIIPKSGSILYGDANKQLQIQYGTTPGQPLAFTSQSSENTFLRVSYDSVNAINKFEIPSNNQFKIPVDNDLAGAAVGTITFNTSNNNLRGVGQTGTFTGGPKGDTGATGAPGSIGEKGTKGATGAPGTIGPKGAQGPLS